MTRFALPQVDPDIYWERNKLAHFMANVGKEGIKILSMLEAFPPSLLVLAKNDLIDVSLELNCYKFICFCT